MITVSHTVGGIAVTFAVNAIPIKGWPAASGLYAFTRLNSATHKHDVLYLGQAVNFADRLSNHERWDEAVRSGMTHVLLATFPQQGDRDKFEELLIGDLNPPLNIHHRTRPVLAPTADRSALGLRSLLDYTRK